MIAEMLKKNRPNISDSSINTYTNILTNMMKRLEFTSPLDFYTQEGTTRAMDYLNGLSNLSTRKTKLASIVSLCPEETAEQKQACHLYRINMIDGIKAYNDQQELQTKSEKQQKQWVPYDKLQKTYKSIEQSVAYLWRKEELSLKEYNQLLAYVLSSMYMLIPPRRIQDFQYLHWIKTNEFNYVLGNKLYFNKFKTAKTYDEQVIEIPTSLKNILKKWKTKKAQLGIKSEFVFTDMEDEYYSQPELTKMLTKTLGVSVNMIRHIYISDVVLKNVPALTELKEVAQSMGHSTSQQILYRKR